MSVNKLVPFAALAILATAGAFGLASPLAQLHYNWTLWYASSEHGYLVLAASLWIAGTAWRASPPRSLRPDWWALLPLGALIALLGGLELMYINNSRLLLLPPLVLSVVALVFGRESAKRLFLPAMFLYFALPQWWIINGLLQSVTTSIVTFALGITRVPAFVEGNFVHLPAGTFEIASGCSGLNYLQVGTALAAFYALMHLRNWRHGLVLLGVAAVAALVSNWIRVYSIVLVGHLSDMQHYLITEEHHTFGWLLFLVSMSPVLVVALRLEGREARWRPADPVAKRPMVPSAGPKRVVLAAVAAAAVLLVPRVVTPGTAARSLVSTASPLALAVDEPRTDIESGWEPTFVNANEGSGSFVGSSPAVEVYRAIYPYQDADHRLIRPGNDFLGSGFRLIEEQRRDLKLDAGVTLQLAEYRGVLQERPRLIWAWYWVAGIPAAGRLEAKIAEVRGMLNGRRDGVAVALAADCIPDCGAARDRLAAFARLHGPQLQWSPEPIDHR